MQLVPNTMAYQHGEPDVTLSETLICFSHLRWDFVFQRPQHLLTRFAHHQDVFYIEEPVYDAEAHAYYTHLKRGNKITVIVPHIPNGLSAEAALMIQQQLFGEFMSRHSRYRFTFWYYTPMALLFTRGYNPELTIFDCMDELAAFKFAPEELKALETELLAKADIVFTGGFSLYEAKKGKHINLHVLPSSIDKVHFAKARTAKVQQQRTLKSDLRLGFYGVIDERFDMELIREIAAARPEWQLILIGPVVKIDADTLPRLANIHYLGPKTYNELPGLITDWDVALIPFLLNESTRFISPTKTPEYLAAGLRVISTPIRDVINPYGKHKLVNIGHNAADFIAFAEEKTSVSDKKQWLQKVDFFLANNSWDLTFEKMSELMRRSIAAGNGTKDDNEAVAAYKIM